MILENLHAAIEARLAERLPRVMVATYPDLEEQVSLPLLVLELAEFEPGDDPGTGELALVARMEGRVVVDPVIPHAELYVRQIAARLAAEVRGQMWGQPVSPARVISVAPDGFKHELEGYLVWCVTWTHELHVGEPEDLTLPALPPRELVLNVDDDETTVGNGMRTGI